MSVRTELSAPFKRLNGMRIGTIIAITASSGTRKPCGVMTRLPSTAPTTASNVANDQRDDSASERMHAFVDERGRQNVEEHYDDVHDRTTEVCHEQAWRIAVRIPTATPPPGP